MSQEIIEKIKDFLVQADTSPVQIDEKLIDEFAENCKALIKKQFTSDRDRSFRVRMSGIGRPLCQLQMEKAGAEREQSPYNNKLRFLIGDMIEALTVFIIKSSGIKVDSEQKGVKRKNKYFENGLTGTYDIEINNKIFDIKSASDWSFKNKFNMGFGAVAEKDVFGYLSQGYLYADTEKKDFGGWIVINKSSGEICLTEPPKDDKVYKDKGLKVANDNINALMQNKPFERCFDEVEETYRNKLTGNKRLDSVCEWCSFKHPCWGGKIQKLPQQVFDENGNHRSKNPRHFWYTFLAKKDKND